MAIDKSSITQIKLSDGTLVGVNEHVYLTPEHLGEPYYIGRIMEFCKMPNRKGLQVRVAWYNRPKDVFNLKSYDASLLIATMNSDLNPVSSIRGKCKVVHKYYIPKEQFEHYKTQEDRFYYTQLYDRYMQRVYDLLPCDLVQNVPMDVQEALCQRYQFIVVEQGKAADLTGARRTCCVCQTWCNSASSVKCAGCQKNFHMTCLSPPLNRKPSKGFAWQCAFCSKNESDDPSESSSPELANKSIPSSATPGKRATRLRSQQQQQQEQQKLLQKQKQQQAKKEKEKRLLESSRKNSLPNNYKIFEDPSQVRTTHMWPFRYFGVNTNIKDILDIDDRIYPRAASRIGSKYQATVPDWKDPSDLDAATSPPLPKKKLGRPTSKTSSSSSAQSTSMDDAAYEDNSSPSQTRRTAEKHGKTAAKRKESSPSQSINDDDLPKPRDGSTVTRGTDHTITPIFSKPGELKAKQLDDFIKKVQTLSNLPFAPYSADAYDLALLMLEENQYNPKAALDKIRLVTKEDFAFLVTWQPDEIKAFEQSIQDNGHELFFAKKRIPTKSMADIVRFFYQWKKSDRYEPVYSVWTKVYKPTKQFKKNTRSILDCLGKYQQNDSTIMEAFSVKPRQRNPIDITTTNHLQLQSQQQQERKHSANMGKRKQVPPPPPPIKRPTPVEYTTYTDLTDTSDEESEVEEVDDSKDKSYRKSLKFVRDALSASAESRPVRLTRRTASLAKLNPNADTITTTDTINIATSTTMTMTAKTEPDSENTNLKMDYNNNSGVDGHSAANGSSSSNGSDNDDDENDSMTMAKDPSVIPSDAISNNGQPFECNNCHTTQSMIWRRMPGDTDRKQKVFDRALCDECGTHWLKYSKRRPVTTHTLEANGVVANVKARGRALKRKHSQQDDDLDMTILKKTKEDAIFVKMPPLSCQVCYSTGSPKRLLSCMDCKLVVHYDCFGIDEASTDSWRCDVCKNKKKPTVSNFYQCTLCGSDPSVKQHAMKPTSGYYWSHVTCALFFPQVKFIDSTTMSPIEYIGSVANTKRKEKCKICSRTGVGSYIRCDDDNCNIEFHAQCAVENGYQAGFTIESPSVTVKGSPNENVIDMHLFGRSSTSGVMVPRIYCPHHDLSSFSHFYPMGTRSQVNRSWIKIYSSLYKQVGPNTTPAMRRYYSWCQRNNLPLPNFYKHTHPSVPTPPQNIRTNRKLTLTLTSKSDNSYQAAPSTPSCSQCPVTSSPFWWSRDDLCTAIGTENVKFVGKICQRCYCKYKNQAKQSGADSGL